MTRLWDLAEWKEKFCKQESCKCLCDDTSTVAEWFICSFSEYNGKGKSDIFYNLNAGFLLVELISTHRGE